jgi:hypothetical protein
MEESEKQEIKNTKESSETSDIDPSNILQPLWFRRIVRFGNEMDRILLENRSYLLLHIGILFWCIIFFTSKVQK